MTVVDDEFDPKGLPEVLAQLFLYWNSIKGGRLVPNRRDFDPVDIPRLLPYLILVEVLRNDLDQGFEDFQFRLIGTHIDERMRDRYTGRRLSGIEGKGPGSEVWETYFAVKNEKKPKILSMNYIGPTEDIEGSQEIFLPLSANGDRVDFIVVGLILE